MSIILIRFFLSGKYPLFLAGGLARALPPLSDCLKEEQKNGGTVKTPLSNTGFSLQTQAEAIRPTALFHWIQGVVTIPSARLKEFVDFCLASSQGVPTYTPGQGRFCGVYWDNTIVSSCKALFLYKPDSLFSGYYRLLFSFTGSWCERLCLRDQVRLIMGLYHHWGANFTRIDVKYRIPSDMIDLKGLYELGRSGQIKGCRPTSIKMDVSPYPDGKGESYSVYFGASGSDSRTVFYDPYVKHGVKDACDIETRLFDGKALEFAKNLVEYLPLGFEIEDAARFLAAVAVGQISFIDRQSSKNVTRAKFLPFWQKIVDSASGSLKIWSERIPRTFERSRKWIKKQVLPTIAALMVLSGNHDLFFAELKTEVLRSIPRISSEHLALIEESLQFL